MKKVKIKLNHAAIQQVCTLLLKQISIPAEQDSDKILNALCAEAYLRLQLRGAFYFTGLTSVTLTTAQALVLKNVLIGDMTTVGVYEQTLLTEVLHTIDKQTA